jgi:hypothetical protein
MLCIELYKRKVRGGGENRERLGGLEGEGGEGGRQGARGVRREEVEVEMREKKGEKKTNQIMQKNKSIILDDL